MGQATFTLPPLGNNAYIGEIIVNVRPVWIRRPQRATRINMMLNRNRTIRPVFGIPNVFRAIENKEPPTAQELLEKQYTYCDARPHTALGSDSGQRFFCGLGPLTRGWHSFIYTLTL